MLGFRQVITAILLLVAAALFGYAGWRVYEGEAPGDQLPLFVGGVVCIAVLVALRVRADRSA